MPTTTLRAYLDEVGRLADQEALEEVIGHCKYILTKYPKNLAVYRLYGRALLGKSRYDEARDIFERILSAAPNDFAAHISMSEIFQEQGQDGLLRAIFHLERAFEQDPNNPALHDELRRLYELRDGAAPDSIQLTQEALARLYFKGQLYDQATAEINAALRSHKDRPDLLILLMQTQWANFRPLEAADTALRILRNFPYSQDANRVLAQIWLQNGRPSDARPYLERLGELNPFAALELIQPDDESAANQLIIQRLDWNARSSAAMLTNAPDWVQNMGDFMGGQQLGSPADMAAAIGDDPFGLNNQRPVSGEWMLNFTAPADVPVPKTDWFSVDSVFGEAAAASTDDLPDWFTDIATEPAEPPEPAIPSWLDDLDDLADVQSESPSSGPAFGARSSFELESLSDPLITDDFPDFNPVNSEPVLYQPDANSSEDWQNLSPELDFDSNAPNLIPDWDALNAVGAPIDPAESGLVASQPATTMPSIAGNQDLIDQADQGSLDLWADFGDLDDATPGHAKPSAEAGNPELTDSINAAGRPETNAKPPQPDSPHEPTDTTQAIEEPSIQSALPDWLNDANVPGQSSQGGAMTTDNVDPLFDDFDDLDSGIGGQGSGLPDWLKQQMSGSDIPLEDLPAEPASALPDWLSAIPSANAQRSQSEVPAEDSNWLSSSAEDVTADSTMDFLEFGDFAIPEFDDLNQTAAELSISTPGADFATSQPADAQDSEDKDDWFSKLDFGNVDPSTVNISSNPIDPASILRADERAETGVPALETSDDDWLTSITDSTGNIEQAEASDFSVAESTADAGIPNLPAADDDWLSAVSGIPDLPEAQIASMSEPISASSDDDWLSALGGAPELPEVETADASEPVSASSDDDWLSALGGAPELPEVETADAPEPVSASSDDDWLSALGGAPELPEVETADAPEPVSASSDDDWLSALGGAPELSEVETADAPEPVSASSDDDWLSALGGAPELSEVETADAPEPVSASSDDDWLSALGGAPELPEVETADAPEPVSASSDDDWLSALGGAPELPEVETADAPEPVSASSDDDWLSALGGAPELSEVETADAPEPVSASSDDDWLSALGGAPELPEVETADAPEPVSASSDDDWLSALGGAPELSEVETADASEPVSASSDDDWLSALGGAPELSEVETADAPEPVSASSDDDWLSALGGAPELPEVEMADAPEPVSASSDDDWLSALGGAPELPEVETADAPEPVSASSDDDWLSALGGAPELPEVETADASEPVSASSDDDWLSALDGAPELPEVETADASEPVSASSDDDWLSALGGAPELSEVETADASEPVSASNDDDWLSALSQVPTLDSQTETTVDVQMGSLSTDQLRDWMSTSPELTKPGDSTEGALSPLPVVDSTFTDRPGDDELLSLFEPDAEEPQTEGSWLDSLANSQPASRPGLTLQDAVIEHPADGDGGSAKGEQSWLSDANAREQDRADWLATLGTSIQAPVDEEIEPVPVDPDAPAWLSELEQPTHEDEMSEDTPPRKGITGLLGQIPPPQPDAATRETGVLEANDVPDWMQAFSDDTVDLSANITSEADTQLASVESLFGTSETGSPESTAVSEWGLAGEGTVEPIDMPSDESSTIPDWLVDVEQTESRRKALPQSPSSAGSGQKDQNDDSDWLAGMRPLTDATGLEDIEEPVFNDLMPARTDPGPDWLATPGSMSTKSVSQEPTNQPATSPTSGAEIEFGDIDIDALLSEVPLTGDQLANNPDLIDNTAETKVNPPNRFEFDRLPAWLRKRTGR